jgi:hypothetical protein
VSASLFGLFDNGATRPTEYSGDAAGLALAKADGVIGGMIQMGPGLEALVLGSGWGPFGALGISLVRVTKNGELFISRLHACDGADPTKCLHFDVASITTGTQRIARFRDWTGYVQMPSTEGNSGEFLRSGGTGVQPTWAAVVVQNALLDGSNHTDTLAGSVLAGDLIFGNATPKWARLPVGSAGQVLTVVAGAPAWSTQPSAVEHNALSHIAPLSVPNSTLANGSNQLNTTTPNGFATVRVGDFVFFPISTGSSIWGARVSGLVDSDSVTLNKTNSTGSDKTATVIITPGDHWDDTAAMDVGTGAGYFVTTGRGTYDASATPGGTFQEIRGPVRWSGYESAMSTDFRVLGSTSSVTPYGFCLTKQIAGARVYFMVNNVTANRVLTIPDATDTICLISTSQTLDNKDLNLANKIRTDGTATYSLFRTPGGADRLGFDLSPMTALRAVSWPDYAGRVPVEGAPVTFTDADTTPTVAGSRVFLTANTGATSITTFDDSVNGQEITVIAGDNNTTIVAGANMKTVGGANIVLTTDDAVRFVRAGSNWYQASPVSVNA